MGAYEMTMNFYETSLLKHSIQNYLFLSTDSKLCELLNEKDIPCIQYSSDPSSDKRSVYGSKDFIRKMNIRTYMILDALKLGYNVLHTDVDVIFRSNPFLDLPCLNGSCDVAVMWDDSAYNAGFLFLRSNNATIELYKDMKRTAETTGRDDQLALNDALKKFKGRLKIVKLSEAKYSCGKYFYEDPGRHFGDDPSLDKTTAIVIHNNWIVSIEAKIYRFKELLQWSYDGSGYYSSNAAKYISYENPMLSASADKKADKPTYVWKREKKALQNALMVGALLNRSVILPKFHCKKKLCSLLNWIKIKEFDVVFKDRYRENLFLTHSKVPSDISSSVSPLYLIESGSSAFGISSPDDIIFHEPSDEDNGPSDTEILQWYGNVAEKILRFKFLNGEFKHLQNLPLGSYSTSIKAFEIAFVNGNYRQM